MATLRVVLDEQSIKHGLEFLVRRDEDLAGIVKNFGPPPFWQREPGFPTLVYLILEQQVSLASAKAAYERLLAAAGSPLRPERFLEFDGRRLKRIGFSRQKASYCRLLARSIFEQRLSLEAIGGLDNARAPPALFCLNGFRPLIADPFLLLSLRRAPVSPCVDLL